jgi:hypothetical protein
MTGAEMIANERQKQIDADGWTAEHDDDHSGGEMIEAAVAYARFGSAPRFAAWAPSCWPWDQAWWRPGERIRTLVKAGALIAAEIDRLQRTYESVTL